MEHDSLTLEMDKDLIDKVLEDVNMRYIILFLYIIRNDMFNDFVDEELVEAYERILILDEIFKGNVKMAWEENFLETAIDLGLFKNIRSLREFEQKDDDFILKMGEETVTIEDNTLLVPDDTLFLMISKKFKGINRRNFNLSLNRLKSMRCERTGVIHPFIFQIGANDYTLADDLYYILDQFGNVYQSIKVEITIEGFHERFKEIKETLEEFLTIYDGIFTKDSLIEKLGPQLEEGKELFKILKEEKLSLPDKFELDGIDPGAEIVSQWEETLIKLIKLQAKVKDIDQEIEEIKNFYSGTDKKNSYLQFIEKISFNVDNIVNEIQESLIKLRKQVIQIDEQVDQYSKKELKLLNLDHERFLITSRDE